MNKIKVLHILPAFIILLLASVAFAAIPVTVTVGKGTVITLKEPSKRVSLADPSIADMNLISPTEMVINGKKVGSTNLIVWDRKGKPTFFDINVVARMGCGDTKALEEHIKELAPDSDITAECEGDVLVLRGTTKNRYTCKRDKEPLVTRRDEKSMVDVIETQERDTCVETFTKIEQLARFYAPKVLNLVTIPEAEQIVLEVRVAQINKTKLKELGLSTLIKGTSAEGFSNLAGAPSEQSTSTVGAAGTVTTTSGVQGIAGNASALGSFTPLDTFQLGVSYFPSGVGAVLRALASKGLAKVLAEPNLVVRSGEKGDFLAGSEVPIQTVSGVGGQLTPSITYKKVGVEINFAPQVLETGAIRLRIDPAQVSNIQQFISLSGILAPIIDTRQVTTSVDLKSGESLILAGLLSDEMKKNIQKIPILGDIPILGALFRSTSDELTKTDLAFFITPKLVKPLAPGVKPELPGEKPLTPEEEGEYEWIPFPRGDSGAE
ncbi:MAG: pilus assembly protein N-terminal domain-containing protein [Candidatus Sulfobium sp.]|jgi:pilus assembly protein CpaC